MSVIDLATNLVIATIGVDRNPFGLVVNPAGTFAYVTNFNGKSVSVIALWPGTRGRVTVDPSRTAKPPRAPRCARIRKTHTQLNKRAPG